MKQFTKFALLASVMVTSTTFALETISGDVNDDHYATGGVLFQGVASPSEPGATSGSSTVTMEGAGTLTIGSATGGGFPRVRIFGGTTITSNRSWGDSTARVTWWDGQFSAPRRSRLPNKYDINRTSVNNINVVSAFAWGLSVANETFSFSTPAEIILPVTATDGDKLFIAYYSGGSWNTNPSDFCIVSDGLCLTTVSSMSAISIYKELYETCPITSVLNGKVGTVPSCRITCDRGFELNEDASGCVATSGGSDLHSSADGMTDEGGLNFEEENQIFEPQKAPEYEFRPGYFRYQGTDDQRNRKIDVSGLTGDDLKKAQRLNNGYYVRNPRSVDSQIKKEVVEDTSSKDDSFLNYILQIRNRSEQDKIANSDTSNDEEVATGELADTDNADGENKTYHSGAPLLPSTGPEIFMVIAVVGFLMMLFGARRRN